jgi:phosphoserine phosphatase RsbU/P
MERGTQFMTHRILVVDDEPDLEDLMRQKFRRRIRSGELEFHFAHNGFEALERLRQVPGIEMVLTDINMPQMDGLTLLGELAPFSTDLKAVVVSAYGDLANIRTAMNRGAFDFLTKPIDFADLEVTIAKTLEQMEHLRQGQQAKTALSALKEELELAGALQQSILPTHFPLQPDHSLFARMVPAKDIGGDFYDFFYLDDRHLGIVMADVSGKGVMAAMFMGVSRTLLRFTALQGMAIGPCLAHVNNLLCTDNESAMFVTVLYGILDLDSGRFTYGNAGHLPPYWVRQDGRVEPLPTTSGIALGVLEGVEFQERTVQLQPGDSLFLYTDGVTEACNLEQELFGDQPLIDLLRAHAEPTPVALVGAVVETVGRYAGTALQADDITVLAVRYTPA